MYDIIIYMGERNFLNRRRPLQPEPHPAVTPMPATETPSPDPETPKPRWLPGRLIDRLNPYSRDKDNK